MSATPSQPLTSSSEPAPVVSDISAPQPLPAVSPAPVSGTPPASDTSGAGVSAASAPAANPGPMHSAPAPLSQGPPLAPTPPQPQPHFNPRNHSLNVQRRQVGVPQQQQQEQQQQQYWGYQPAPSYPRQQAPQPVPSNRQMHHPQPVYTPPQPVQTHYQSQPAQYVQQQQSYQPQSSRPVIMEPPRKRASMGMAAPTPQTSSVTSGFPSPTKDYPSVFPKFKDDLSRNSLAIKQSVPEAVRQAVRDNWEKCLLGSEFHQAFVVSTGC
ncbi:hypothetical protein GE09DRAFT_1121821 [Coniochaeta sp. 2T2.1]|nr:hypothetical protein GE09DRAFT_1121821 [Coniochaeta sp. 2T2.1]